nr:hypothetical protein CFP56_72287 [Quercus suber]
MDSTSWLAEKKSIVPSRTIHEGSSYAVIKGKEKVYGFKLLLEACTRRFGIVEGTWNYDESKELQNWKDKITRYTQKSKKLGGHLKSADTDQNIINGRWRHCSLSLRLTLALSLSLSRLLHSWIVFHSSLSRLAFSHKVDPELAVDIQNGVGDNSADIELELVDPELAVDIQNGVGDNSADIELELGNDGAMIGSSFETTSNDGH